MRILLLGEYSNVHTTLARALTRLGHEVVLASDGDSWKDFPRDVNLQRPGHGGILGKAFYWNRLRKAFLSFRGFDVVQIINPVFIPLKAERIYDYYMQLRHHNGKVFMGAFGMDYYYALAAMDRKTFRYSDFYVGDQLRQYEDRDTWIADWVEGEKGKLNRFVAEDCNGIVAGLYEYYAAYAPVFSDKLTFIPFPIDVRDGNIRKKNHERLRFFIGIQKSRTAYKGTDIMLKALEKTVKLFPDDCEMVRVENVPFAEYCELMDSSDVILDQLYAYTPAMNALEAMARGLVVVGGGEQENYAILGEHELRPIINVQPNERSVFEALCRLVRHRRDIPRLQRESVAYVRRHHDSATVAKRYLVFWQNGK